MFHVIVLCTWVSQTTPGARCTSPCLPPCTSPSRRLRHRRSSPLWAKTCTWVRQSFSPQKTSLLSSAMYVEMTVTYQPLLSNTHITFHIIPLVKAEYQSECILAQAVVKSHAAVVCLTMACFFVFLFLLSVSWSRVFFGFLRLLVFTIILNALLSRKVQTTKATESYKLQQMKGFYLSKLFLQLKLPSYVFFIISVWWHLCSSLSADWSFRGMLQGLVTP